MGNSRRCGLAVMRHAISVCGETKKKRREKATSDMLEEALEKGSRIKGPYISNNAGIRRTNYTATFFPTYS